MAYRAHITSLLSSSLLVAGLLAPSAHADVMLSGDYDSTTTNANQVDVSATSDANTNQLSLASFETLVESAFLTKTGGVITFNADESINWTGVANPTWSNIKFSDNTVLARIQRTVSGTSVVNDATSTDRTPISGTHTFGGQSSYAFVFSPDDAIVAVGLTVISRSGQTAGNATITATFVDPDGLNPINVAVTDHLASVNATDDTFFGFKAPSGKVLSQVAVSTPYFTRVDDLGVVITPEPGTAALAVSGALLILAGRGRR